HCRAATRVRSGHGKGHRDTDIISLLKHLGTPQAEARGAVNPGRVESGRSVEPAWRTGVKLRRRTIGNRVRARRRDTVFSVVQDCARGRLTPYANSGRLPPCSV